MLLDRAATLATKINTYQKLRHTAEEGEQFATRATQFGNVSLQVARLRQTLSSLAEASILVDFKPSDGLSYAEKARVLREAIKVDPAKLNDPPFDIKHDFTERLTSIASMGQKAALTAWKAYVEKRTAFGADDVLSALAQVPQFKASVGKIKQIRIDIASFGSSLPADPKEAIVKLDAMVTQHETAWSLLDASDIPPSVVTFIRAAANSDALLSAFTPEVQMWLETRGLLGAFRIKLR
jgi:hypothetical protein